MTEEQDYKYDLFISYNRADEVWAEQLAARLEHEDYLGRKLKVFFAPWDIRPGEYITESLEEALPQSRKVGLIVTPQAMQSEWVKIERLVTTHIDTEERSRRLIPLYRRACDKLPALLRGIRAINFEDDAQFEKGYQELLAVVRDEPLPRGTTTEKHVTVSPLPSIPRAPVFGFVSRRDEQGRDIVERLKEELAPGRNKLVTLSGPGGIGKSTLAAETARGLQDMYEGRIVWSSADGRTDFTLLALLDDIAAQLGRADLRTLAPGDKEEQVRALVSEPATLVVLDNYETIAGEEKKRIEAWFKTARCSSLFTSRHRIPETVFVQISAMSRGEAEEFLEKLISQAQEAQTFSAEVRMLIYETAEANPFVMQWVVAQVDEAEQPDTVLKELMQGEGDAAERVFHRSFNLLDGDGRDTLLALSLFAPSATRAALSAVAGLDDEERVRAAVKNLHRLWLVKGVDGNRRLAVEGLTRTLADARLSRDTRADEFRPRFVAYFLRYAVEREKPTPENYNALEEDKDNLLSAADAAFVSGDWRSVMVMAYVVANPATGSTGMLVMRGYWDEAIRLGEQALQAARFSQDEAGIAGLSLNMAGIYLDRGEPNEARRLYDESLEIAKRLGNQSSVALTVWGLGNISLERGYFDEARKLFHEALETFRNLGDEANVSRILHQLGRVAQAQGETVEARRLYNESLEIKKRLGNQNGIAITLHQLGMLAQNQGELEEAGRLYNESLEIAKKLGNQSVVATTLHNLAALAQNQGELVEARRLYDESLEIAKKLGDQGGVARTLHQLGRLVEDGGNKVEAAQLFREALSIFERLRSPNAEIARRSLARVEGEAS